VNMTINATPRYEPVLPVREDRLSPLNRWAVGALGLVLMLVAGLGLSRWIEDPARFPITNVDILGTLDYADRSSLQEKISLHTGQGFYALDIDKLHQEVESFPWIASARINRIWPGRVSVEVEEHEPAALWNEHELIAKTGVLLEPPQLKRDSARFLEWQRVFEALPLLSGGKGRESAVMNAYRLYAIELEPFDITLISVDEDQRRSQTLTLSNDVIVKLGYEEHELRLGRFLDVYSRLVTPLGGRRAQFDMRYSNGFALQGGPEQLMVWLQRSMPTVASNWLAWAHILLAV